jgi:DNA-binding FadR family transcriptional regulator
LEHAEKPESSREDHIQIIDAIQAGNADALERVIREHIDATVLPLRKRMGETLKREDH